MNPNRHHLQRLKSWPCMSYEEKRYFLTHGVLAPRAREKYYQRTYDAVMKTVPMLSYRIDGDNVYRHAYPPQFWLGNLSSAWTQIQISTQVEPASKP